MSLNIGRLMEAVETGSRYGGYGVIRDYYPGTSYNEAVAQLNYTISESTLSMHRIVNRRDELLMEATIDIMNRRASKSAYGPISEGAFQSIKEKVKGFFDKIIKWVKSIIAKVRVNIEKWHMSGNQMWERYHEKLEDVSGAIGKSTKYNGYKLNKSKETAAKFATVPGDIENLMNAAVKTSSLKANIPHPSKLHDTVITPLVKDNETHDKLGVENNSKYGEGENDSQAASGLATVGTKDSESNRQPTSVDSAKQKQLEAEIKALNSVKEETAYVAIAKEAWDITVSASEWKSGMQKTLYGEKVDIKWGEDMFTVAEIRNALTSKDDLDKIISGYEDFLQQIDTTGKELESSAAKSEAQFNSLVNDTLSGLGTTKSTLKNLVSGYYTAFLKVFGYISRTINAGKEIYTKYCETKIKQAKGMLVAALTAKPESQNSSYDFDFDF